MRIKIIKEIVVSSVSKQKQKVGAELEVVDSAAKIYIKKGFAEEIKKATRGSKKQEKN